MPELNTDTETLRLFRAIRGAPATILLLLMVRGASMTGREMALYTGFDNNTITKAKDCLEALGLLQYNGRLHGWSLRAGSQLLLPFMHLLDESYPQPVDKEIGNSPIYDPEIGNSPIYALTTTTTTDPLAHESGSSSSSSKSGQIDRKISDLLIHSNGNGHNPPTPPAGDDRVATWLRRAGVGEKSKKWSELMAAGLDWRTVRALALERLAQPNRIWVGLFIKRPLEGDPPPAPRCPRCYSPLSDDGWWSRFTGEWHGEVEDEEE